MAARPPLRSTHVESSGRVDLLLALVAGCAAALLYRATWQEFMFDDGPTMATFVALDLGPWYHVLLVPLAIEVKSLIGASDGRTPLLWVSTLSGAIAVAATFGFLRRMDLSRVVAGAATALLALSPALWFHSTTTEVHALHAACVATAALVTTFLPWGRGNAAFVLSTAVGLLLVGTLVLAHRAGIAAGAGFLALAWWRARRAGTTRPIWVWLLFVGPAFLAGGLLASRYGEALFGRVATTVETDSALAVWEAFGNWKNPLEQLVRDWIAAWPAIAVAVLLGLARTRERSARGPLLLTTLAGVLPALVLFAGIGLPSMGGYALTSLPFVMLAAAYGLLDLVERTTRTRAALCVLALLALQLSVSVLELTDAERVAFGRAGRERAERVAELLPDGGFLLSVDASLQLVTARDPHIHELGIRRVLPRVRSRRDAFPTSIPQLDALVAVESGRVLWDPNWRLDDDLESVQARINYLPFEDYLERHFTVERVTSGEREFWRLSHRGSEAER